MKSPVFITALVTLLSAGCASAGPDYTPVGTGLSVIGCGIVVAAAISALLGHKGGKDE